MSDHSGRQGRIISITPSVAQKNTNKSTPKRRSHRRAAEGDGGDAEAGVGSTPYPGSVGDLSSPTLLELLAKGSLGSEIIARVIVGQDAGSAGDRFSSFRA